MGDGFPEKSLKISVFFYYPTGIPSKKNSQRRVQKYGGLCPTLPWGEINGSLFFS